ncbi:lycopene cyclase [Curtobacterium sp. SGAir0471]|uniref:lycopene cyclase family protein n=1 Tax=Curtobacterium sp. SGAir0471 TaxID=2070337 RepID=UPI0010CCBD79|nr:lycopene cyclase family protein [Curtobacterium sp. SGAir0471]QCR44854.1 lycopene cyclase [Curtobacterium sp. SGAir0471]
MSTVSVADTGTTTTGAGAHVAPAPGPVAGPLPATVDVAVVGGGCSGTATAIRLAELPGDRSVLVLEGRSEPDPRSWCSWDDGSDPLPEARSASWTRWEVRTDRGASVGTDPAHPYVLVRAADRRAAAERRLAALGGVRFVDGAPVTAVTAESATDGSGVSVRSALGEVRAGTVLDARGPRCPEHVDAGRVLLHQRFVGHWITADRPVFDTTTATLMDFSGQDDAGPVRFVYVLPVSPTEALVESTLFSPDAADPFDHEDHVERYVERRWGLRQDEWRIVDTERGCIPMTDAPVRPGARWSAAETVLGTTRPSSGYGFARSNRHCAVVAQHLAAGAPVPPFTDGWRTRFLDAVFLRFLRDRPEQAPEAFRRLFALPGPLVVRFLTERSTPVDELRIVLALQKPPFLAALGRTVVDAVLRSARAARSVR